MNTKNSIKSSNIHMLHLDGLRGLAALYVVFYHAVGDNRIPIHDKEFPSVVRYLISLISFGQAAVAIFIVLSGYCLMMPLAQLDTTFLRGGVVEYLKRRARRILPVYYAALIISLLLIAAIPALNRISESGWDASLPAFRTDIIVSHLLLFHNLSDNWSHKIDYPMWSVATEWQIYFIFALILLPLQRRFGLAVTVISATLLGLIPHWLFNRTVDKACFEFIGLFAFGMAGAVISFSSLVHHNSIRNKIPWGTLALILLLPIAYFAKFRAQGDWAHLVLSNIVLGLATVCLLIYCANALQSADEQSLPLSVRFLKAKPCVVLGSFSYSLYLIHAPVLALLTAALNKFHLTAATTVEVYLIGAVPLCVLAAYLFYLLFEKPFLVKRKISINS